MADNSNVPGVGLVATDEIAGVKHQRVKVQFGPDGTADDVHVGKPLPVRVIAPVYVELGEQVFTPATSTGFTVPAGATIAVVEVTGQPVRFRAGGRVPTASAGHRMAVNETQHFEADLAGYRFIQEAATATMTITYFKEA